MDDTVDTTPTEGERGPVSPDVSSSGEVGDDGTIHFHFPIDVQIVGGVDGDVVDTVVARVFDELRRELERSA